MKIQDILFANTTLNQPVYYVSDITDPLSVIIHHKTEPDLFATLNPVLFMKSFVCTYTH